MGFFANNVKATLIGCILIMAVSLIGFVFVFNSAEALNITNYSNTISDSGPEEFANHNLKFTLGVGLSPGSIFELTPPAGFEIVSDSVTFTDKNVELLVNGISRPASSVGGPGVDQVEIMPGSPGMIRYTLAPDYGIASGQELQLKIGNNTSGSVGFSTEFSTTTGTTTTPADIEPIRNSTMLGAQKVRLEISDGGEVVAREDFIIHLNEKVSVPGVDTTETVPPFRFGPAPTTTVGGTTQFVEISLETDEFAWCRYDIVPNTDYWSMPNLFSNTGLIFHSHVVPVTPASLNTFYVRCLDDEGNFNIDDFLIEFVVNEMPTGQANTEGATDGDGTGSGNTGSGSGSGGGGQTGESDGEQPLEGGTDGAGGSGGGGGGGGGGGSGSTAGGGFEKQDDIYPSGDARVIISGYAFPSSAVGIIVDGKFFGDVKSSNSGQFSITLDAIARGVYTFGVYAEGPDKVKSSTFSTSFTVTGSRTSSLSNINVAPSIKVSPDPVQPGQTLTVSGYALPNSTVTIQNGKINTTINKESTAQSDASGKWTTTIDTNGLTNGTYQVRAKSVQTDGVATGYSSYTFYGVGQNADVPLNADLNRDGKINLVDFSILLFWWNGTGGDSDPPADINRDEKVNLTDFSIMLFNWTG
jgi:hypothetical protein